MSELNSVLSHVLYLLAAFHIKIGTELMKFPILNVVPSYCFFVIEVFPASHMLNCYIVTSHCPGKKKPDIV